MKNSRALLFFMFTIMSSITTRPKIKRENPSNQLRRIRHAFLHFGFLTARGRYLRPVPNFLLINSFRFLWIIQNYSVAINKLTPIWLEIVCPNIPNCTLGLDLCCSKLRGLVKNNISDNRIESNKTFYDMSGVVKCDKAFINVLRWSKC